VYPYFLYPKQIISERLHACRLQKTDKCRVGETSVHRVREKVSLILITTFAVYVTATDPQKSSNYKLHEVSDSCVVLS